MMEKDELGGFEDRPTAVCPDCGNHYFGEMKYFSRCDGEGVIWHIVDSTSRRLTDPKPLSHAKLYNLKRNKP